LQWLTLEEIEGCREKFIFYCIEVPLMSLKCVICGREGVPLLEANLKDRGYALICAECWQRLMAENKIIIGGGSGCPCG
ncbi:MAG: hypothetical protein QW792_04165, partial [Pyrobaculum sp.]